MSLFPIPKRLKGMTPSHVRARDLEKETAARVGARQTRGSGCGNEAGDSRIKSVVRIENKTTKNKSFSVTTELIEKLEASVFGTSEIPVMQIELELGRHKVIVMPDWALDIIAEALREARDADKR